MLCADMFVFFRSFSTYFETSIPPRVDPVTLGLVLRPYWCFGICPRSLASRLEILPFSLSYTIIDCFPRNICSRIRIPHNFSAHLCLFDILSQHSRGTKCLYLTIKKHPMAPQLTLQIKEALKSGPLHPLPIQVPNSGPRRLLLRHRPGRSMWRARLQLSRSRISLQWMEDWQPGWSYSLPFSSRHCLWVGNTQLILSTLSN